ncbi:hypothetical protein HON22_04655 [Candidatus Peregrinibacteria bacterium]|jgi:hypothetical protein|nr:hypothetical protein [Candidatus Peregrinibacteria bacterium]
MKESLQEMPQEEYCNLLDLKTIFNIDEIKKSTDSLYPWSRYYKLKNKIHVLQRPAVLNKMEGLYREINSKLALYFASFPGDTQLPIEEVFTEKVYPIIQESAGAETFISHDVIVGESLLYSYQKGITVGVLDYVFKKYPQLLEKTTNMDIEDSSGIGFVIEYAQEIQAHNKEKEEGSLSRVINAIIEFTLASTNKAFVKMRSVELPSENNK